MRKIIYMLISIPVFLLMSSACQNNSHIDLRQQKWFGRAICYSGYRQDQSPQTGVYPTQEQILQDMRILQQHWKIIRTYGSDRHSEDVLQVIRNNRIRLKVMLGAWLDGEPGHEQVNAEQVETCIRLANEYNDIVIAVNVGNEVLVSWSDHRVPEDNIIRYVKTVQDSTQVPVTVADDFTTWRDDAVKLAETVDFIAMHTYPIWGRQDIDTAMKVTLEHYHSVKNAFPGKTIVISEAGWATYTVGELHAPKAGDEKKQARYFNELTAWARRNDVNVFFFEAFDEPWKGAGTEGHWGLFSVDRKAKLAMQKWYPQNSH